MYHTINIFIHHHQYNSFHQQLNPLYINSIHHTYRIQHINLAFISCSIPHQFIIHIILTIHELSNSSSTPHEIFCTTRSHNQTTKFMKWCMFNIQHIDITNSFTYVNNLTRYSFTNETTIFVEFNFEASVTLLTNPQEVKL